MFRTEKGDGTSADRNEGVELFRCVSMILILTLHILGQGGVLGYSGRHREQFCTAWFLETIGYCSVNCYALISGFVNKEQDFKFSRFFIRWLEVVFWLVVPLIIAVLFLPGISIGASIVVQSLLPLTSKTLWYFNAYVLLFPFIPLLNIGLEKIGKRAHALILIFLFTTTCTLHVINGGDNFVLGGGYCGMWLIILYVFGAFFRLYGIPEWAKWYITIPTFLVSAIFAWAMEMHKVDLCNADLIGKNGYLWSILDRFVNYTSPFMVIMALSLLFFFAQMEIKPIALKKIVVLMGRCSFGVYLFHVGPIMWDHFMYLRFKDYASFPPVKLTVFVMGTAIVLFLLFDFLSVTRYLLFKYCGINRLVEKVFDAGPHHIDEQAAVKQ